MKIFTSKSQKFGEIGEQYAKKYLINNGYIIFDTNFTRKFGEIDVITIKESHVDYFEVKSMSAMSLINARDNLAKQKIQKLIRICGFHFTEIMKSKNYKTFSIHALLVKISHETKSVEIELLKNINI